MHFPYSQIKNLSQITNLLEHIIKQNSQTKEVFLLYQFNMLDSYSPCSLWSPSQQFAYSCTNKSIGLNSPQSHLLCWILHFVTCSFQLPTIVMIFRYAQNGKGIFIPLKEAGHQIFPFLETCLEWAVWFSDINVWKRKLKNLSRRVRKYLKVLIHFICSFKVHKYKIIVGMLF